MFKPNSNVEPIEVLTQPEQRRRRSLEEKLASARDLNPKRGSVSGVARRHQVNANQVFAWRKLYKDGSLSAVSAGEQVVPASDLVEAMKHQSDLHPSSSCIRHPPVHGALAADRPGSAHGKCTPKRPRSAA